MKCLENELWEVCEGTLYCWEQILEAAPNKNMLYGHLLPSQKPFK